MNDTVPSVAWVRSAADIAPALWEICFPPPLEGRWWYETLEFSGLEEQFSFFYGLVSFGNRVVAIAPVFLMDVPIGLVVPPVLLPIFNLLGRIAPALLHQRTLFIGSPCAEEGTVGIVPGTDRRAVLYALQKALSLQARHLQATLLAWKDFPPSYDKELLDLAQSAKLFRVISFPGTVAPLVGKSKESYFAALKGSRRYNLKKKLRRSAEHLTLDIQIQQGLDASTLDELFGLFMQTYNKAKTKFERLGRRFFEHIAAQRAAYFIILREQVSGDMVAFMLCFGFDHLVINKFIGIDYRRPKEWLLYFRLWEAALDWAIARGASAIQSGQTGYAAKIEVGHRLVPLTNYCQHRNPLLHWCYAMVARTVDWHTLDSDLAHYLKAHLDEHI